MFYLFLLLCEIFSTLFLRFMVKLTKPSRGYAWFTEKQLLLFPPPPDSPENTERTSI